tara:strand:- start:282 stop:1232 length:951 start_codon:yes stop_codon:yes gene_type:complete
MTIDKTLMRGINALKEKRLQEAEQIFKIFLQTQPMNPEANHFLGITFQLLNKMDAALASYKKTIKIKPNFIEAHKHLADILYRLGKIVDAEICYNKVLELKPNFAEAITILNIISEQKKVLSKINLTKISKKKNKQASGIRLISNPFVATRKVETELITSLYQMKSMKLDQTKDIRYGNGKCSPDLRLFKSNLSIIKYLEKDLIGTMKQSVESDIYVVESFFNILSAGSGTTPHRHLDPFDKAYKISDQKYSLVYYLSTGDQNCSEPGILKLYDPDKEILPSEGSIVIIPASRRHSAVYNGKIDRVMIGVNFYSLT